LALVDPAAASQAAGQRLDGGAILRRDREWLFGVVAIDAIIHC
jgi:hypothetical protein